mmetsp:Transcript_53047/g.152891  ORF Transcript_53047/g.152891 Transcript_53047/m.152891 type:complete len:255 (-) Transcript_53047:1453-2217(-)
MIEHRRHHARGPAEGLGEVQAHALHRRGHSADALDADVRGLLQRPEARLQGDDAEVVDSEGQGAGEVHGAVQGELQGVGVKADVRRGDLGRQAADAAPAGVRPSLDGHVVGGQLREIVGLAVQLGIVQALQRHAHEFHRQQIRRHLGRELDVQEQLGATGHWRAVRLHMRRARLRPWRDPERRRRPRWVGRISVTIGGLRRLLPILCPREAAVDGDAEVGRQRRLLPVNGLSECGSRHVRRDKLDSVDVDDPGI